MDVVFKNGIIVADLDEDGDDYDITPEVKEMMAYAFKGKLGGNFCPSHLLKLAEQYGLIPLGALEVEEAAYLLPYYNLLTEIKRLILVNDKRQFASFLVANHELVQNYPPEGLLQLLCTHSAVACAAALLESRLAVDVNCIDVKLLSSSRRTPLHLAARKLCFGMTELLLEHGADANICAYPFETPLCSATDAFVTLIRNKGWTARKSILALFDILPELKEPLDTVRLLASSSNDVEYFCIQMMDAGNVEHYAALLMAAWDKLMVPSSEGGLGSTPVGQHLTRVLSNTSLQQEICDASFNTLSQELLVKNLTKALYVVKTMWMRMTLAVLERHCHSKSLPMYELPSYITCELAKDAGLDLKPTDNIQCPLPKLTPEAKVLPERKHYVEPQPSRPILRSFLGKSVTSTFWSPSSSSMSHLPCRTFHTLNFMETHLRKTPQVKPSSHNVLALAKACAPLVRFGKRSIK